MVRISSRVACPVRSKTSSVTMRAPLTAISQLVVCRSRSRVGETGAAVGAWSTTSWQRVRCPRSSRTRRCRGGTAGSVLAVPREMCPWEELSRYFDGRSRTREVCTAGASGRSNSTSETILRPGSDHCPVTVVVPGGATSTTFPEAVVPHEGVLPSCCSDSMASPNGARGTVTGAGVLLTSCRVSRPSRSRMPSMRAE